MKSKIYRTIILPAALYGSENCSLTLRDERRLRVFEKEVLSKIILGFKREEAIVVVYKSTQWGTLWSVFFTQHY